MSGVNSKNNKYSEAIRLFEDERKIDPEVLFETLKESIVKAYQKFIDAPEAKVRVEADAKGLRAYHQLDVVENDYKLYDENDQVVEDANIHSTVDQIQVTLPVNVIKELPLALNFIESPGSSLSNADYTITPEKITVSGDAELLKDIDQIVLDDFDLSELNSSATYYYNIPIPDGCENLSGTSRATLKISYKDMTSRTLEATHFQCENVPSGKVVSVLTSELSVTLRGKSADVAAVQPEDLVILADLKDVSSASGSYTVPAEVQIRSDGDVGVVGTYQIKITLSEEEHSQPAEDENNTPEG